MRYKVCGDTPKRAAEFLEKIRQNIGITGGRITIHPDDTLSMPSEVEALAGSYFNLGPVRGPVIIP